MTSKKDPKKKIPKSAKNILRIEVGVFNSIVSPTDKGNESKNKKEESLSKDTDNETD